MNNLEQKQALYNYLAQFVTDNRMELIQRIVAQRTRYLTVVLEDIFQPHNASAVLRTADCLGIQDVHIIENKNKYKVNPDVVLGAAQWLNLEKYNTQPENTLEAINRLKMQGYRIVATTPHQNDVSLDNFDLQKGKVALFFGTEIVGLSQIMLDNADEFVQIPMYGFTESFNISVSAAIILHHLAWKLRNLPISWQLTDAEKLDIKIEWLKNSAPRSDVLVRYFYQQQANLQQS